jgi:hypothetical protein
MIPLYSDGLDRGGATWRPYKAPTQSSKSAKKELLFLRCAPSIKLVARQNRCTVGMKRYRFGIGDKIVLRENIACSYIPRRSPYGLNHFVLYALAELSRDQTGPWPAQLFNKNFSNTMPSPTELPAPFLAHPLAVPPVFSGSPEDRHRRDWT